MPFFVLAMRIIRLWILRSVYFLDYLLNTCVCVCVHKGKRIRNHQKAGKRKKTKEKKKKLKTGDKT